MTKGGLAGMGACLGGDGGGGGDGGAGGGGVGGISVGIVWSGTVPAVDEDTSIEWGSPGGAGTGGDASNSGIPGIGDEMLEAEAS